MNYEELDFDRAIEDANKIILLGSALKTGLFSSLTKKKDIPSLARELGADERALYIVLEALCAMGYVEKKKDGYIIADRAHPLFINGGKDYVGGYLPHTLNKLNAWLELPQIIIGEKTGRRKPDNISTFINAMASTPEEDIQEIVNQCLDKKKDAKTVLDLGGGPGKYSKVFVNRGLKAVLLDTPETIDYVSDKFGLTDIRNLTLKKSDFTEDLFVNEFEELFDIVFMGNITHIYSEDVNRSLLMRVGRLLNKGGMVAIEDFVRARSPYAEMFAVNMLANTEGGGTWTEEQYIKWLKDAGFSKIEVLDLADKEKQLITAFLEK
ncbi:MAG: methyltransferase (plasmid) [Candidatus Methanoperedens sp.]|uniref:methyltransferase domain-containing protein n=1 Tax=Candidatus Methanoperedens sp. BLZ2 TaxID=2035255 RepID=UPI000BE2AE92|nr:methyltransferase domain-containing protein [Candidatus Methanoperedens sp. BLZ2]KAB2946394.1 MAG: methyltransferase domain-containing protein [Candidatus Methanoperedens sp.]MBZ0175631.1 methyltransferase domain-containing protein [Candidatus Methanoperedens nitroreducens]WAH95098.1 MAG: methyltransferase [Candidatus Methanoperedens sp.]WAM22180.1 MAG: methyltransferase [Candidatus Methanoperedens sp.]